MAQFGRYAGLSAIAAPFEVEPGTDAIGCYEDSEEVVQSMATRKPLVPLSKPVELVSERAALVVHHDHNPLRQSFPEVLLKRYWVVQVPSEVMRANHDAIRDLTTEGHTHPGHNLAVAEAWQEMRLNEVGGLACNGDRPLHR